MRYAVQMLLAKGSKRYYHGGMNLDQYFRRPDAMSVSALRIRMNELGYPVKSNAQLRQWRYAYGGRRPDAKNCVGLELATGGLVTRQAMRPEDWEQIWPVEDASAAA